MTDLLGPFNWWSLEDGEEAVLTPVRFQLGTPVVAPPWATLGERVQTLRIWVPAPARDAGGAYVDATSKRLISVLTPLLESVAGSGRRLRIQAAGSPPRTEYTVTVEPA